MSIEALIFDVDGTLADTEEAHRRAFNSAFERCGLGWCWSRAEYRALLGVTGGKERLAHHIRATTPPAGQRALLDRIPALHAEKTHAYTAIAAAGGIALRPGIARLLDEAEAAGLRLAIASTTTAANIDALLRATLGDDGVERFDVIACGDQVRAKKPAPDIYALALQSLGVPPEHAIAIEDSANGLRSATAAGLWTLVTPTFWTEGADFGAAGLRLPHLGDPGEPVPGEPGSALADAAWLTLDELLRVASPVPARGARPPRAMPAASGAAR
ncbi:MAG TPA: HAD-IA family hydrolase [Burkholderiaceae bacterium]|nr:HAD-IA family hydrolase [Burkholderiaceae bacterium]